MATALGLQAYARDLDDGALTHLQTLGGADPGARLFWDEPTDSMIAATCTGWRRYARSAPGGGLATETPIGGAIPCAGGVLLRGSDGTVLHLVSTPGMVSLQLDKNRGALAETGQVALADIAAAAIRPTADYVYVHTPDGLHVLARGAGTDALDIVHTFDVADDGGGASNGNTLSTGNPHSVAANPMGGVGLLSVDAAGRYLLAVTATQEILAFELEDPAMPRPLVRDTPISRRHPENPVRCTFADMRAETLTLDIFCTETAHSVRLLPDTPALRTEDTLDRFGRDAFDGDVPLFTLERGLSASPNGRHVYATAEDEILIFERAGSH